MPPPCDELTTSEPALSATRVRPPGAIRTSLPDSTNGRRSIWRGAIPASTKAEVEDFRKALLANPAGYIAQPTLSLSTCPTYVESGIAPRHIDLRPFVLSGTEVQMVPGGLTRVALKDGSLVVNSSQGGGTKDTWVLEE